jgi:hypothetical protein
MKLRENGDGIEAERISLTTSVIVGVIFLFLGSLPVIGYFRGALENPTPPEEIPLLWMEDFRKASQSVRVVASLDKLEYACADSGAGLKEVIVDRIDSGVDFSFVIYGIDDQPRQAHSVETLEWLRQLVEEKSATVYFLPTPPRADFYTVDSELVFIARSDYRKKGREQNYARSEANPIAVRVLRRKFDELRSASERYL